MMYTRLKVPRAANFGLLLVPPGIPVEGNLPRGVNRYGVTSLVEVIGRDGMMMAKVMLGSA